MCETHRHMGGSAAVREASVPREKARSAPTPSPQRPQLEVVAGGQAEVSEAVQTAVPRKVDREKIKPQLIKVAEDQMGISTCLGNDLAELIVRKLIGDSAAREDFDWAMGIIDAIEINRLSIVNKLRILLSLKIGEKNDKPSEGAIRNMVEQVFEFNPQLKIDINFATAWARRYVDEFFSAPVASQPADPVKPASQRPVHLGGTKGKAGREVSVPKVEVKVETPVTAKVVDAEIVEASASGVKLKPEVDLKDMEARLRKKIQGAVSQKTSGSRLNNDELLSITVKLLPQGCDGAVVEKAMVFSRRIMDEIELTFFAPSLAKTLPEAKPAEVVPPQKIEPVVPPAAVKSVETPPVKPENEKQPSGFLSRLKALVGIGQKPVAEQSISPKQTAVAQHAWTVVVPKVQPAVKQEKPTVQLENPAAVVVTEAPKAPKIQESSEKTDLRTLLTDLRSRESTLRKGERGKDERKAFYRSLAGQLVQKLKIKSTGDTITDRKLINKELLKLFSEQELRTIGPEWLFK